MVLEGRLDFFSGNQFERKIKIQSTEGTMSGPNEKQVAEEEGVTVREVREAWHQARNDAVGTDYEVRPEKVTEIYETITTIQPDEDPE